MPMKGWKGELERHSLASKGIKTKTNAYGKIKDYKLNLQKVVIVDIDGTLFDTRIRWRKANEIAKPPSPAFWEAFMSDDFIKHDTPLRSSAKVLNFLVKSGYKIIYLSGRRDEVLLDTEIALEQGGFPEGEIFLRRKGLKTEDFKIREMRRLNMEYNVVMSIGDSDSDEYVAHEVAIPFVWVLQNSEWDKDTLNHIKSNMEEEEEY